MPYQETFLESTVESGLASNLFYEKLVRVLKNGAQETFGGILV